MYKNNEWVMLLDQGIPAQIQSVSEGTVTVKLQNNEIIIAEIGNIRKRKNCVCKKTMSYPFCDGSHSR